jgi:hypothetical protein
VAKVSSLNSYLNQSLVDSFGDAPIVVNSRQFKIEASQRPVGLSSNTKLSCQYRSLCALYWWSQEETISNATPDANGAIVGSTSWRSAGGELKRVALIVDGAEIAVVDCGLLGADATSATGLARDFYSSELFMRLMQAVNRSGGDSGVSDAMNLVSYGCSVSSLVDTKKVVARFASAFDLSRSGGPDDAETLFSGLNTSNSNVSLRVDYTAATATPSIIYTVSEYDVIHTLSNGVLIPTY